MVILLTKQGQIMKIDESRSFQHFRRDNITCATMVHCSGALEYCMMYDLIRPWPLAIDQIPTAIATHLWMNFDLLNIKLVSISWQREKVNRCRNFVEHCIQPDVNNLLFFSLFFSFFQKLTLFSISWQREKVNRCRNRVQDCINTAVNYLVFFSLSSNPMLIILMRMGKEMVMTVAPPQPEYEF